MGRCDELEKLRTAQQEARLSVHAAAIKQLLNIAEPDQHQRAQTFLGEHFGELYTVKENVAELRKAILQLAVMGKLVPQDPNDQPASELLKEIEAEKERLVKEGKIRKPKPLPPVTEEKRPYVLPQGWEWVRLGEIVEVLNGRAYKQSELLAAGTPVLRVGNLFTSKHWYYSTLKLGDDKYIENGDLIYAWSASFGPFIWQGQRVIYHYHIWKLKTFIQTSPDKIFLYNFLLEATDKIKSSGNGIAMLHMTKERMEKLLVPLPPLKTQHRIVAKLNELIALCDSVEEQINAATSKQAELLNALMGAQSQRAAYSSQPTSRSTPPIIDPATYRANIGCYAINKLANTYYFGRTTAAKVIYLAQAHIGLDLNLKPERQAAGPLDTWLYEFERQGVANHWFEVNQQTLASGKRKTEYRCLPALSGPAAKAETLMSPDQKTEFDGLIRALDDKTTEEVEIIATLFAVWNDFLIDGIQPTDAQIISDVRENWHKSKARFSQATLSRWLDWLRQEKIVPQGRPPRTQQQTELGL